MRFGSKQIACGAVATAALWLLSVALVVGQAPQTGAPTAAQGQMAAEQVFKNVTVLKGIPVDEFMGTMGVFSAALGFSCEDCHTASSNDWANYAKDVSPRKTMARQMVTMMQGINKQYFGGRQVVTCFTCHRGSNRPKVTASLDILYGAPPPDELDVLVLPAGAGGPTAAQILDKYLAAIGGAQRAAAITSFLAKGMYSGYGPEGFPRPLEIYAKAPNQKTVRVVDPQAGDNITVFNGTAGWQSAPFKPIDVLEYHGADLDSLRADAEMVFPGNIKTMLTAMRTSNDFINDRTVLVVQGNKGNAIVTLYFDEETGLLTRSVRSIPSPVGRLPFRMDYSDYRDVNGVKLPFKWELKWLDGRSSFEIENYQMNVTIDAARFNKPAPPKPY
jgi:photosynthetic reaction center cytochrome c subunit